MKTEVYSWRITPALKSHLRRTASLRNIRVSTILDLAVQEWLAKNAVDISDDEEQKRLHAAVAPFIGVFSSGKTADAKTVRETIRKNLARKYGR